MSEPQTEKCPHCMGVVAPGAARGWSWPTGGWRKWWSCDGCGLIHKRVPSERNAVIHVRAGGGRAYSACSPACAEEAKAKASVRFLQRGVFS